MKHVLCRQLTMIGLMVSLMGFGCGDESLQGGVGDQSPSANPNAPGISAIQISPTALEMKGIGTTIDLNLIVRFNNGEILTEVQETFVDPMNENEHDVAWSSDNPFVAQFDAPGRLRAVSAGETSIHAVVDDLRTEIPVTVTASLSLDPVDGEITIPLHVSDILISAGEVELVGPGDSFSLTATLFYSDDFVQDGIRRYFIHPSGEVAGQIGWFSTNPNIATVSGYGIVQAVAPGETTVIVYNPWTDIFPTDEMIVTVGQREL